ncbi:competence type IV pilus minor pilin ComGD [Bacillus sp. AK031]
MCRNDSALGQRGYTLVEMMIVMLIFMTLLFFASFSISPLHQSLIKSSFISQMKADLYYLQSYAINKKERVIVQFYPFGGKYSGRVVGGEGLLVRNLPEGVSQIPNSLKSITFYPNGNTSSFGNIYYTAGGEDVIKLSFQIGQGRFNVEE